MHYKNGKESKLGDLVVGPTHNSDHKLRIGRVLELMPKQGPCNLRLMVIGTPTGLMVGQEKDIEATRFHGGKIIRTMTVHNFGLEVAEDFADCKDLVTVLDAYKALNAIESYSRYDSPYFPAPPLDF